VFFVAAWRLVGCENRRLPTRDCVALFFSEFDPDADLSG
jgi:hypothetical protein